MFGLYAISVVASCFSWLRRMRLLRFCNIHKRSIRTCIPARRLSVPKIGILLVLMCVSGAIYLSYHASQTSQYSNVRTPPPQPQVRCNVNKSFVPLGHDRRVVDHKTSERLRIDNRVLVLIETQYSGLGQEIVAIFEATKIAYKAEPSTKPLPYLTYNDRGKYGVIVFENLEAYVNMDKWNRQLLDKYCREYKVGVIIFTKSREDSLLSAKVQGFPLFINTNLQLRDFEVNPTSQVLRVTRAGETWQGTLPGDDWTVFIANHSTYEAVAVARLGSRKEDTNRGDLDSTVQAVVIQDRGTYDGVKRVIFGHGFKFWLHRLLFLDSISLLSHGKMSIPLERHILVDIDDIFVGKPGVRVRSPDVTAMLNAQEKWNEYVENFRFNLGFSGKYFHRGDADEDAGDDELLEKREEFWWFPHMFSHTQPHVYENSSALREDMLRNQQFAKDRGIPVNSQYAIAPHHSGVYPVQESLYTAWKQVWGVKVTSTEEYPHLKPPRKRRGFVYRGIQVLPRQTCGLFSHTLFIDRYPGGRQRLEDSIRGGDLFQSILYNPMNIFMTHMPNFANDRLALYTFESVFKFVRCWTNLHMKTIPPQELGDIYFKMYPEEKLPVWQNPCKDKRHLAIWSANKTCDRLPRFLVIGPQKTGTTALYTFLSMHPAIISNYNSPKTFEEVQFFSGNNYLKGLDWYMNFFPLLENASAEFLFEKSATYFDKIHVPQRAAALLPQAKLICILTSPARRAYSWYQHMRAHKDPTSLKYTFYEVITASGDSAKALRSLSHRCLNPGLYAQHLDKWLTHYPAKQLLVLDGELLKNNPMRIMDRVQKFLSIVPTFDYTKKLRYDQKKGFYCQVINEDHNQCLGRSKGRRYAPMDSMSAKFLAQYYRPHNVNLQRLLTSLGQEVPKWLQTDLKDMKSK